ncbi:hypothetical protein RF11_09781 [Thelohanellus kitauei]|uniref:Uncharacterized protein n=1 Tax=Thelohanellus kitauei TaxID=669202 RepID=A0A0C2MQ17_THEKT|nr:hypothetical protein RF11_09781 [Thelohanellus kitauei]
MVTKRSLVPAFEVFNISNEYFCNYLSRLEQHFFFLGNLRLRLPKCQARFFGGQIDDLYKEILKILMDSSEQAEHYDYGCVEFSRFSMKPEQSYKEWVAELRSISKCIRFQFCKDRCLCNSNNETPLSIQSLIFPINDIYYQNNENDHCDRQRLDNKFISFLAEKNNHLKVKIMPARLYLTFEALLSTQFEDV